MSVDGRRSSNILAFKGRFWERPIAPRLLLKGSIMSRLALAAVLLAFALPAQAAEECTDKRAEALSDELFAYVEEFPEKGANLEIYIEEVEAEFGAALLILIVRLIRKAAN